jgi:carbonic anhydrase/acetyltransferase-like protein (isoleucine patch superfamily)
VYIGAILTIAGRPHVQREHLGSLPRKRLETHASPCQLLLGKPVALWDILGKTVLERTIERLRIFGIDRISVISENSGRNLSNEGLRPSLAEDAGQSSFWTEWDSIVSDYLNHEMETLLLVRLGPYAEVDFSDLLSFHKQSGTALTQVQHSGGALDLVVVDAKQLRMGVGSFRSRLSGMLPERSHYEFKGYLNRLTKPANFRRLVADALMGRCAIRPVGREVSANVWLGDGAYVEPSASVIGPAYVGTNSYVGPACTVSGGSTIERQCKVDFGTVIDGSCILPQTYVGMGLSLANVIAGNGKVYHLGRDVEVGIADQRLIGDAFRSRELVRNARTLFESVLSTRSAQRASLISTSRFDLLINRLRRHVGLKTAPLRQPSPVLLSEQQDEVGETLNDAA